MIPTNQTRFDGPAGGNCLAACIATIFEIDLKEIDTPRLSTEGIWQGELCRILNELGYQPFFYAPGGSFPQIEPPGLHIACNDTHAVVAFDGRVLFDPHPRRLGLSEITEWILLLPIAPEGE